MKNILVQQLIVCMALAMNTYSAGVEIPIVEIDECAVAPSVDGKLDDECWKKAYHSSTFYDFKLKSTAFKPVSMRKRKLKRVRYIMENTDPDENTDG